jgi:hypothetical protein
MQGATMADENPSNIPAANEADVLAAGLAHQIMSKPDYKMHEYVAAIYRDADGNLKSTELFTSGDKAAAPLSDALRAAGGSKNVVGVVHNHPPSIVDAEPESNRKESADINKLPSDNDWKGARKVFGERTDVDYYVLGPDNALRKYDYQDNQAWDRKNDHQYWDRNSSRFQAGPALDIPPAPDPRDPKHADHALYEQILGKTRDAYASAGRPAAEGEHERVAASLLVESKKDHKGAITHADAVVFSVDPKTGEKGRHIFVVQGDVCDPAHHRSSVKTSEAAKQPIEESFDKLYDLNQRQFLQQTKQAQQQTTPSPSEPAPTAPALAR